MSQEFQRLLQANNIKYTRSAAHHPATNGPAECFAQIFKHGLQLCNVENRADSIQLCLDRFMLAYRNCPHMETGESPALHFLERDLTTKLNFIRPASGDQYLTKCRGRKPLRFWVEELVWARGYVGSIKWLEGRIRTRRVNCLIVRKFEIKFKPRLDNAQFNESETLPDVCDSSLPANVVTEGGQASDRYEGGMAESTPLVYNVVAGSTSCRNLLLLRYIYLHLPSLDDQAE